MLPEQKPAEFSAPVKIRKKPVICSMILAMALTYFLVLFIMFFVALVFSGDITKTISYYYRGPDFNLSAIIWFTLVGTFVYLSGVTGIILMLANRKSGFYLFFLTALTILLLDFIVLDFDWLRYLIHSGFIFLLGILHFSGRCYIKRVKTTVDKA
jgi:uncharacterized membrane protein YgdD (TMEM256/DUF423 family)